MPPIGLVDIYPSVPRSTDPRAVPSRASAKRRSHLSADHSSLRRAALPCLNQSSAEGEAWCHRSVSSISTHLCRETPIRAPFHRVRAPIILVASRLTRISVGCHARPRPVSTRHRPRVRLGVTDRSYQYSPIGISYGSILSGSAGANRLLVSAACYLSR